MLVGEHVLIGLTRGLIAFCDKRHFSAVSKKKWYAIKCGEKFYACHTIMGRKDKSENKTILLHRFIADPEIDSQVDHINGNEMDNRDCNLRVCSHKENSRNRRVHKNSKTGIKGVSQRSSGRFYACINYDGRRKHIGSFRTVEDAKAAYDAEAKRIHGDFFNEG